MGSLYWNKKTPLDKTNMDIMVQNDLDNYNGVISSQAPPIGFRYSFAGEESIGTNWSIIDDPNYASYKTLRHHWHVVDGLSLNGLQMTDVGIYRVSAWQRSVSQTFNNLAPPENDPSRWVKDGWEVGLRMDGQTMLTTQVYAQSGHSAIAYPEAYIRIYRPERHSFQVVCRPYNDVWPTTSVNRALLTANQSLWPQAKTTDRVVWGDADAAGTDNQQLTGYHIVQFIGS